MHSMTITPAEDKDFFTVATIEYTLVSTQTHIVRDIEQLDKYELVSRHNIKYIGDIDLVESCRVGFTRICVDDPTTIFDESVWQAKKEDEKQAIAEKKEARAFKRFGQQHTIAEAEQ